MKNFSGWDGMAIILHILDLVIMIRSFIKNLGVTEYSKCTFSSLQALFQSSLRQIVVEF